MRQLCDRGFRFFLLLLTVILTWSCSQPVLESANCVEARDSVKRLYSIHLDQGPNPDKQKLEAMREFITAELYQRLAAANKTGPDYLTQFEEFPKAFRVGTCRERWDEPELDVLLFWRRGDLNSEEKIVVSTKKEKSWKAAEVRKETR